MSDASEQGPPLGILAGRRALEGLHAVELLEDWVWHARLKTWVGRYRLSPSVKPDGPIPAKTEWYVLVDSAYPWGAIKFYPAKNGGITQTFPHQNYNGAGRDDVPWRNGDLCLDTTVRVLGRHDYDVEPYSVHERLHWQFLRALRWLEAASRGELAASGHPYELPQYPIESAHTVTVAFAEGVDSFTVWQQAEDKAGPVELVELKAGIYVVTRFPASGRRVVFEPSWGETVGCRASARRTGIWLRLKGAPALQPWQAPVTWGELRAVCRAQGIDLDQLLKGSVAHLRDGGRHIALLGFPIPAIIGGPSVQWHWQAMLLPRLAHGTLTEPGFRTNALGYWQRDRNTVLRDRDPLMWLETENWHPDQLATRGRLVPEVTNLGILIVGAGAVGSAVAELLTRAGVRRLVVLDGDRLMAGNLARHTLGLDELHEPKASGVATRLNRASPHARVVGIDHRFPPEDAADRQRIVRCNAVIDCTGEDAVLHHLEQFSWDRDILYVSLSVSLGARRLYCFVAHSTIFPHADFRAAIRPWLLQDMEDWAGQPLPREGVGCWHPVFPARADDIWLLAAAAIKYLEGRLLCPPSKPELLVFEQFDEDGRFGGVRRIEGRAIGPGAPVPI